MERLKAAKEKLLCAVEAQLGHLESVDAHELGEVVDMVKDFEEAMYYCAKVKELEEKKELYEEEKEQMKVMKHVKPLMEEQKHMHEMLMMKGLNPEDEMDHDRMYYPRAGAMRGRSRDARGRFNYGPYPEMYNPNEMYDPSQYPHEMLRDAREGKSPLTRKNYMETKELKKDPHTQNKELEKYLGELSDDIFEMIDDATPEQKTMISQKLSILASKIK